MAELRKADYRRPRPRKARLLRRASFDLIGLPPSPEEFAQFLADDSPDAFARVVDRLLASPRYGERWGRHWMDVVRYADTAGDNADYPVPEAASLPRLHHRRVQQRQALRPVRARAVGRRHPGAAPDDRYAEQVIATGFLALIAPLRHHAHELWHLTIEDTIDTVGPGVPRAHTAAAPAATTTSSILSRAEDYYALYGIFDSTRYPYAGSEEYQSKGLNRTGFVPLGAGGRRGRCIEAHARACRRITARGRIAEKHDPHVARLATVEDANRRPPRSNLPAIARRARASPLCKQRTDAPRKGAQGTKRDCDRNAQEATRELRDCAAQRAATLTWPARTPSARGAARRAGPTCAASRREAGPVVNRTSPQFLRGDRDLPIPGRRQRPVAIGRVALTSRENPLAARVMVNRLWQ